MLNAMEIHQDLGAWYTFFPSIELPGTMCLFLWHVCNILYNFPFYWHTYCTNIALPHMVLDR